VTEPFQLDWHIDLAGDRIARLRMVEEKLDLPAPVLGFVRASQLCARSAAPMLRCRRGLGMVGIIDGDRVCARFTAPDSLVNLIIEVGKGEVVRAGQPS
jgi:hypothetical protein